MGTEGFYGHKQHLTDANVRRLRTPAKGKLIHLD